MLCHIEFNDFSPKQMVQVWRPHETEKQKITEESLKEKLCAMVSDDVMSRIKSS